MIKKKKIPSPQTEQPGIEKEMDPRPQDLGAEYQPSEKLLNKVAVITGGDSGIGRATAILFAKEGAKIAIIYMAKEEDDAQETKNRIEKEEGQCLLIQGDIREERLCFQYIEQVVGEWGQIDILVNNAAIQFPQETIEEITSEQLENTFRTNIFSYFYMTKSVLKYLKKGASIINTTSVTAYKGSSSLLDYSSTKGAIVSFTRSLALALCEKGIRVNGVAPGPVWTPLIVASFDEKRISEFGENVAMKRAGQPDEIAPCFVFLASSDSSYMTGQVLHPNGGTVING